MPARYVHMLSWGILYGLFSLFVVCVYKRLDRAHNSLIFKMGNRQVGCFYMSDFVIYLIITTASAIRLNTGSDFYNYYQNFNQIKDQYTSLKEIFIGQQPGFYVLSWIVKTITDYEFAIFVIIAICCYAYLFYMFRTEIKDKPCALVCYMFLGFYAYSNNILKQYIAMAFVVCAYLSLDKKKIGKFVCFAVLAGSFHYSALFVILIMFLARKFEPTYSKFWLSILGGLVIGVGLSQILTILIRLVPSASGYAKYIDWRRSNHFRLIAAVFGMCIMYAILIFIILKYKKDIRKINEKRYFEIIFLIIGLGINVIAVRQWIINRIAIYFYQFIILILPAMFEGMDVKNRIKLKKIIYCLMFLYMIFSSIFLGENEYYSYNTVFSGDTVISDNQYNLIHGWSK